MRSAYNIHYQHMSVMDTFKCFSIARDKQNTKELPTCEKTHVCRALLCWKCVLRLCMHDRGGGVFTLEASRTGVGKKLWETQF